MFEGLGEMLANGGAKIGNFVTQKPEQFAIFADMLGKNLDPNNAFAGIGTAWGQSSLADKAAEQQQSERKQMTALLANALSGTLDNPVQAPVASPTPASSQGSNNFGHIQLSPVDQPGPTSMLFKANPDGTISSTTQATVHTPKKPVGVNLTDIAPF